MSVTATTLTAKEILTDGLLVLLRAKPTILPWDQAEAAMAVLGLTRDDLSEARSRGGAFLRHGVEPNDGEDIREQVEDDTVAPPPPPTDARLSPGRRSSRAPRPAAETRAMQHKQPTKARPTNDAGQLRCSRCREWFDREDFRLRTDRVGSGQRRSACDRCFNLANRSRYLNVRAEAELNAVGITLALGPDDAAARLICTRCDQPLGAEDVETGMVALTHVVCPSASG